MISWEIKSKRKRKLANTRSSTWSRQLADTVQARKEQEMATIKDVMDFFEGHYGLRYNRVFAYKRDQLLEHIANDEGLHDSSSDSFDGLDWRKSLSIRANLLFKQLQEDLTRGDYSVEGKSPSNRKSMKSFWIFMALAFVIAAFVFFASGMPCRFFNILC